jgi:3-methyladenine DNA glycosylase AlkD
MPKSPSPQATSVRAALAAAARPDKVAALARFFKTGKGEYAEGDVFLGVTVPKQRAIAKTFRELPLAEAAKLLASKVHEERLTALFILVDRFERGDNATKRAVVDLYLANLKHVNNWDLVDSSAPQILGDWLLTRDRRLLRKLAASKDLWERRVAMLSTYAFIRAGEHEDAFAIAHFSAEERARWMAAPASKAKRPK